MSPPKAAKSKSPKPRVQPKKVLLLDGHSLAFRAFYALPPELRTSSGQQTNAVFGFTSMLIKALQDEQTRYVAVAFDKGAPVERLALRPEYKAQRVAPPDEFRQQLGLISEVLKVLGVPVFEIENVEADDLIAVLAKRLAEEGCEVMVVTADRDFFQIVGPGIKVMMNRRGISDTKVYDEEAVVERFGFGPDRYLEYAALRGDPSDNIEGVAGVGEKTAARLVMTHGNLEGVFEHLDDLTPKIRENLREAQQRLLENREFFRLRTAEELKGQGTPLPEVSADDLAMGDWNLDAIRRLFDALEFRTLFDRLTAERKDLPAGEAFEAETGEVTDLAGLDRLALELEGRASVTLRVGGNTAAPLEPPEWIALALTDEEAKPRAVVVRLGGAIDRGAVRDRISAAIDGRTVTTHGSKDLLIRLRAAGIEPGQVLMDTEIAAYLIDPARGSYPLHELTRTWLGRELQLKEQTVAHGQQSLALEASPPAAEEELSSAALEAVAVAELAPVLEKELVERGGWELFTSLEIPLGSVLAQLEITGVKIDVPYLRSMSEKISLDLRGIEDQIYDLAGGPFNINSPPQLRTVLYERLGLKPSKKTKTGFSTDASVLESLREEHPIVDAILRYRERAKLKSTYIDALPPLVDQGTGRLHCRFNQTVTATGRLSSDSPNLQNIPIRTAEGKHIRRAFIPEDGYVLMVADYSQIEFRVLAHMSGDPELVAAFSRGEDIHRRSIAKALGIPEDEVSPELRSIGKMVSFGVTYGMGAFGLSQRLHIPVEQARTYIEGFFDLYPRVRQYLDEVVARAAAEGFTTTLLGRRRYLPELQSRNPRIRGLGERMALNAPIQGTAADVIKLAMVGAAKAIAESDSRMVLTVHDELVFEVPEHETEEAAAQVREAMEGAISLVVPLQVDLSWGPNWAEAKR